MQQQQHCLVKEKEEELDSVKKEFKVAMSSVEKKLEICEPCRDQRCCPDKRQVHP